MSTFIEEFVKSQGQLQPNPFLTPKGLCDNLSLNGRFPSADLPKTVEGFGAEVIFSKF